MTYAFSMSEGGGTVGSSSNEGKQWIFDFIRSLKREVRTILDIGPGHGTYHTCMSPLLPQARWTGVEIFQLYIDGFKLRERYHEVINQDIRTFVPPETYDIIFAGDVLEHMTKEEAIAVVEGLMPFCSYLIISIPIVKWEQPAFNGNPFEEHIKDDWSHSEVMSAFRNIEQHYAGEKIGAYVVRGKLL